MHIENPDALKSWLHDKLEPLCDADPTALAKYVYALVKKDRPSGDLRETMETQLEVFLQKETRNFVNLLLLVLENLSYIPNSNNVVTSSTPASLENSRPTPTTSGITSVAVASVSKPIISEDIHQESNGPQSAILRPREDAKRKSESDKEARRLRHRSPVSPPRLRSRSRSRSRSWEGRRRSRSPRDRVGRRLRKTSPLRRRDRRNSWSKSPPPIRRSRSPRSRSRSRSPLSRHRGRVFRSFSRSPIRDTLKKRRLSPVNNSGAATPTQDSNHGDVDMRLSTTSQSIQSVVNAVPPTVVVPVVPLPSAPSVGPPTLASVITGPVPASLLPPDGSLYKRRCRDFDEKGYCMRGDLCPYDHGIDPVVLEDIPTLGSIPVFPPGPPGVGPMTGPPPTLAPLTSRPPPLVPPNLMHGGDMPGIRMPRAPAPPDYVPEVSAVGGRGWFRGGFRGQPGRGRGMPPRLAFTYPPPQRELISIPMAESSSAPNDHDSQLEMMAEGEPTPKKVHLNPMTQQSFDFSRLGPRKGGAVNPANCSLELKKVPRGLNNIMHLNNHFARFGKIVNIQVSYEGDPEAAIVTFSSHAEANAAYRSTEAVLNNRFIKVFWHNKKQEGKQENVPPPARMNIRERLGMIAPHSSKVLNLVQPKAAVEVNAVVVSPSGSAGGTQEPGVGEKVIMSGNNITKTVYIPTALKKPDPAIQENSKALATAAILKSQEILAAKETLKKKQEEKRKEAIKLTANLRKRKQELLEMQLNQQKLLIERLEKSKGGLKVVERDTLMGTIKKLQESIEKIRKDLAPQAPAPPPPRKTKEETLKEILDAELDLFTKQQEGLETDKLKLKVAELKLEAHKRGLLAAGGLQGALRGARGAGRGRAARGFRGRGTGRGSLSLSHAHTSLDHRPTRLLVSGHESDEWRDVLAHFAQFGEIVDYTPDHQTPSLDLIFKTRKDAETALSQGRNFRDRVLSVTWSMGLPMTSGIAAVTPGSSSGVQKQQQMAVGRRDLDLEDEDDEEVHLLFENDEEELEAEEDDDDFEDRSWRR